MWRRVAGGLNQSYQQTLFNRMKPIVLPVKGKQVVKPGANEFAEMWRAAASMERLDAKTKHALGDVLVRLLLSRGRIGGDELKTLQIAPHDVLADSLSRMETIPWS